MKGVLRSFALTLLIVTVTSCTAPLILSFDDIHYMETYNSRRQITIMPLYTDSRNLQMLHSQMPFLSQIPIDQAYYLYEEYYTLYDTTPPENRAVLYIIISTKY